MEIMKQDIPIELFKSDKVGLQNTEGIYLKHIHN